MLDRVEGYREWSTLAGGGRCGSGNAGGGGGVGSNDNDNVIWGVSIRAWRDRGTTSISNNGDSVPGCQTSIHSACMRQ